MVKEREYLLSVDEFKTPTKLENHRAIGMLLLHLLLLEPGSDPLHPDMGVGIINYRYTMGTLDELRTRIADQIATYLPCFPAANVTVEITEDHSHHVTIEINDVIYEYDSAEANVPITLQNVDVQTITNALQLSNNSYDYRNKIRGTRNTINV